jgi:hypothetical protein
MLDGRIKSRGNRRRIQSKVGQAHDLALAHRNAAEHLRQIFAGADPHQQFLDFTECAVIGEALRVLGELTNGLDIGGKPSEPVGGALLAVEPARHHAAVDAHAVADRAARIVQQRVQRRHRVAEHGDHLTARRFLGHGSGHGSPNCFVAGHGARRPYACGAQKPIKTQRASRSSALRPLAQTML